MGKRVLSVTIDEKVLERWKKFAEKNFINSSKLIEKLLEDYLKNKGEKK